MKCEECQVGVRCVALRESIFSKLRHMQRQLMDDRREKGVPEEGNQVDPKSIRCEMRSIYHNLFPNIHPPTICVVIATESSPEVFCARVEYFPQEREPI